MDNPAAESTRSLKSLPFFMTCHSVTDNSSTLPRAGIDFDYDGRTQKAVWRNPDSTNKWSPTEYSDTKVDGVDYVAINHVAGQ